VISLYPELFLVVLVHGSQLIRKLGNWRENNDIIHQMLTGNFSFNFLYCNSSCFVQKNDYYLRHASDGLLLDQWWWRVKKEYMNNESECGTRARVVYMASQMNRDVTECFRLLIWIEFLTKHNVIIGILFK
jgi:hypothetical protein